MHHQQRMMAVFIALLFSFVTPVFAGTISDPHQYAWSNKVGYINFENVVVDDSSLSGYAWATNAGWIKFNPAQGGVANDGAGNLSGFAWGANLGWIDFGNVTIIPSTGAFVGTATGDLVGTLTFDCAYCDVQTTWRQASAILTAPGGGGSVIYPSTSPTVTPTSTTSIPSLSPEPTPASTEQPTTTTGQIVVINVPLTLLPGQSGKVTQDTVAGKVIVTVPSSSVTQKTTIRIVAERSSSTEAFFASQHEELLGGTVYDVTAVDIEGRTVSSFRTPITVALPVQKKNFNAPGLALYVQSEKIPQWSLVPDALFQTTSVSFTVNHLSKFAIVKAQTAEAIPAPPTLGAPSVPLTPPAPPTTERPLRVIPKPTRVLLGGLFALLFIVFLLRFLRRRHRRRYG